MPGKEQLSYRLKDLNILMRNNSLAYKLCMYHSTICSVLNKYMSFFQFTAVLQLASCYHLHILEEIFALT